MGTCRLVLDLCFKTIAYIVMICFTTLISIIILKIAVSVLNFIITA
jgi:hypothetical protein